MVHISVLMTLSLMSGVSGQSPYGLLMTEYGCPDNWEQDWQTGYLHIVPDDTLNTPSNTVKTLHFCVGIMKNNFISGPHCVVKYGSTCPNGRYFMYNKTFTFACLGLNILT